MTLDEVVTIVSRLSEQQVDPDTELFDSGIIDSLSLVELAIVLDLPMIRYSRESWGTCRKLLEEVTKCT